MAGTLREKTEEKDVGTHLQYIIYNPKFHDDDNNLKSKEVVVVVYVQWYMRETLIDE